jgi:hypothetical protein
MGKGIVKLGEGQWATKEGKLLAAKETNGRFKNAEFTVTRGSDATYTDKDGLIKRVSAPRNRNTTSSNTLDLFVLAGQSNAMGWLGDASSYPPQEPNLLDSSIKLNYEQIGTTSKSDGWQTLGPQQRQNYGEIFGPEVTFSRLLKKGGYNPAIFKYTQGSTSLADDWKAPGQSGHYDTMVTKFNSAVLDLQNQGYVVNIAGFIWIQGEQDATDSTDAGNYQSNLNAIISDFRTNVASNSTLQFVLGVDEGNPASNINTIVTAQNNIANGDANIVRSSMVGLEKADSTHLTPAGIIDHGKRIYDSMFDLASAEPRIDFTDNTDGHLLLEPESTNLIPYSEDFEQWTSSNLTLTSGQSSAITSSNDAWLFTATDTLANVTLSVSSSGANTLSVFAKAGTQDGIFIRFSGSSNPRAFFSLSNGTLVSSGGITSSNVEAFNDGWYRISITGTDNVTDARIYVADSTGNFVSSGNIYVQNAQLEELSYATSYIPTNGGQVTRDGETCTGAGEAADFNSEEGVLYAELSAFSNDDSYRYFGLTDGTDDNRVIILYYNNNDRIRVLLTSGDTKYLDEYYTVSSLVDFHKIALKWKVNDFALWVDGVERVTDTSGSVPIGLNTLAFNQTGGSHFYGKCKAIRVYKEALSDSELTTLTS